jgi:catabolite regulation protein CreA
MDKEWPGCSCYVPFEKYIVIDNNGNMCFQRCNATISNSHTKNEHLIDRYVSLMI